MNDKPATNPNPSDQEKAEQDATDPRRSELIAVMLVTGGDRPSQLLAECHRIRRSDLPKVRELLDFLDES